jgi:TolB-like protein/Tfp pilus assembly protein PilF
VVVAAIATVIYLILPQSTETRILVLPFANLSGDPSQEYFSDGVTEELITSLGRQSNGMHVTSLGSSLAYKGSTKTPREIGKELKVDYVVTGSVRRSGDRVRVSAHLMRTRDEAHLWDDSYDREITDILGLQSDVAAAITEGIRFHLLPRPRRLAPRVNAAAYEAYLKGRFFWNKRSPESTQQAISYFQQSIADDANYAPAYVGLADCYLLLGSAQMGALAPSAAMPQAKAAITKALQIDPDLAEAHASLGHIKLIFDWDIAGSEAEFRRAIELNPGYATAHQWYALYFNATGRTDEALQQLKIAEELDPLSPIVEVAIADSYYFARQYDKSEKAANQSLELNPDYVLAYLLLGRALVQQHKYDGALDAFHRGWELSGHAPALSAFLGYAYAGKGDEAQARKVVSDLVAQAAKPNGAYISSLYIATVYTGLRDLDQAFLYLNKAADERCEYLIYLQREPMADMLRSDPRLEDLLARNHLKPPSSK